MANLPDFPMKRDNKNEEPASVGGFSGEGLNARDMISQFKSKISKPAPKPDPKPSI